MIPPVGATIKIRSENARFGFWFPIFLVWLVLIALFILLLPFLALAELIIRASGIPLPLVRMVAGVWWVLVALRGLHIDIRQKEPESVVYISLH